MTKVPSSTDESTPSPSRPSFFYKFGWILIIILIVSVGVSYFVSLKTESKKKPKPLTQIAEVPPPLKIVILPYERPWKGAFHKSVKQLYLNTQGAESQLLQAFIAKKFEEQGWILVDTPAKAEAIVQIAVIYLGQGDESSLKEAIEAGYGVRTSLTGTSAQILLADLLLVEREIAKERNERQTDLATISNRHIRGSLQERFGVVAYGQTKQRLPEEVAQGAAIEATQIIMHRCKMRGN
ncbi:MAG: hypothetical protein IJU40_04080 [Desulfovibrionaceae bacterium]|nr:hypothetical protein [Desulfovibrionaceae bacterium]